MAGAMGGATGGSRLQQGDAGNIASEVTTDTETLANDATQITNDGLEVMSDLTNQAITNAQNFMGQMMGGMGMGGGAAAAPAPAAPAADAPAADAAAGRLQQDTATDINTLNTDIQGALTDAENAFNGITQQGEQWINNAITQTEGAFGLGGGNGGNGGRRFQQDVSADATAVTDDLTHTAEDFVNAGNDALQQTIDAFGNMAGAMAGAMGGAGGAPAPAAGGRR